MNFKKERDLKDFHGYTYSGKQMIFYGLMGFAASFFVLYLFYQQIILSFFGGLAGAVGYLLYQKRALAERQRWELMMEFKDAMDSMVSALVAGYSMENAVTEAYQDMILLQGRETPMTTELRQIKQKLQLQQPLDQLFLDLGRRSGVEDIVSFAQIYATARKSGGNLVKVMRRTAENIGEKMEMQREIQTMISGKRMESGCMIVIPLLIILYLQIFSPEFLQPLYGNLPGILFMTGALAVYILAVVWSRHIMTIRC